jgi:hypothetical protein
MELDRSVLALQRIIDPNTRVETRVSPRTVHQDGPFWAWHAEAIS